MRITNYTLNDTKEISTIKDPVNETTQGYEVIK